MLKLNIRRSAIQFILLKCTSVGVGKTSCCSICLSKSCIITSGALQEEGKGEGNNLALMWFRNTVSA